MELFTVFCHMLRTQCVVSIDDSIGCSITLFNCKLRPTPEWLGRLLLPNYKFSIAYMHTFAVYAHIRALGAHTHTPRLMPHTHTRTRAHAKCCRRGKRRSVSRRVIAVRRFDSETVGNGKGNATCIRLALAYLQANNSRSSNSNNRP